MSFDKLFHKYKVRLLAETLFAALLFAITLSAASVFLVSLIYHFLMTDAPNRLLGVVHLIAFLLGFAIPFIGHYPTQRKIAARIDEAGLQERVSTMLAFRHGESDLLHLQRIDALAHLQETTPSQLKFRPFGKQLLLCLLCVLPAIIITRVPYDIWKVNVVETEISQEQLQRIEDLLTQLREEVEESALPDDLTNRLDSIINQLEQDLMVGGSDLERAAQIENARQQMMEAIQKTLTLYKFGEALQRYELTFALGEAISYCDGNAISSSLLDLEISLNDNHQLITALSETISTALIDSGVVSEDQLFRALNAFAMDLLKVPESEDIYSALAKTVATAEEAILAAMAGQAFTEGQMHQLDDILSQAKDFFLGINPDLPEYAPPNIDMPESSQGENAESALLGGQPENEMPEGGMPNDGQGEGEGDSTEVLRMIEGIYDPISGNVSYGEVYAVYYAEYLKALEAGEVPAQLQEIIDQYFSTLDQ